MASEAQRIMNLSLTKIVSSRTRKGGLSLHRNLLVASVLFKARDVYAAEMAGLVVIRNGFVYDRASVSEDENVDVPDQEDQASNPAEDENLIPPDRIQEAVNAVVVDQSPVHHNNQESSQSVGCDMDVEVDGGKENVKPMDSNVDVTTTVENKNSRRKRKSSPTKQSRKRKYTEMERAILSISEQTLDCDSISEKRARLEDSATGEDVGLDCHELSSTLSECSVADRLSVARDQSAEFHVLPVDYNAQDSYSSSSDDDRNDDDNDDDKSMYGDVTTYRSSFHKFSGDFCTKSSNEGISFSISQPILMVTV